MIAETIYPIVKSLSKEEQYRLFKKLEKELKAINNTQRPKVMTPKQQRKAERMKWLKTHVFYPPKH